MKIVPINHVPIGLRFEASRSIETLKLNYTIKYGESPDFAYMYTSPTLKHVTYFSPVPGQEIDIEHMEESNEQS